MLLRMGLVKGAFAQATAGLEGWTAAQGLSVAELFHDFRAQKESRLIVELIRAKAPWDLDINLSMAQLEFETGEMNAVTESFARASIAEPRYHFHVSEFHRQRGQFQQAIYHGQLIKDPKEHLRARLAIYLEQKNYSLIASLDPIVRRNQALIDDEVRYALAYSLAQMGIADRAMFYLRQIKASEYAEKAALLKQTLSKIF